MSQRLIKRLAPSEQNANVWIGEGLRNKPRWECLICGDISNFRTEALDHAKSHYCSFCRTNLKGGFDLCELCFKIYEASRARFDANVEAAKAMGFQVDFERYYSNGTELTGHGNLPFSGRVRLSIRAYTGVLDWTALNMLIDYADSRNWNAYIQKRTIVLREGETIAAHMGQMMKIVLRQNAEFMMDTWNIVPTENIPEVISRPPYLVYEYEDKSMPCTYSKLREISN